MGKRAFWGDDTGVLMAKMMPGMQTCKDVGGRGGAFVTCHAAMLCYAISKVHTGVLGKGGPVLFRGVLPNGCFEWIGEFATHT